jgi:hypothetical protein
MMIRPKKRLKVVAHHTMTEVLCLIFGLPFYPSISDWSFHIRSFVKYLYSFIPLKFLKWKKLIWFKLFVVFIPFLCVWCKNKVPTHGGDYYVLYWSVYAHPEVFYSGKSSLNGFFAIICKNTINECDIIIIKCYC